MSRTGQFATIQLVVPDGGYSVKDGVATSNKVRLITVGMAQNIRVEDNFGTKSENVIGTPFPMFHPGFQQTTITIEKATIDGYSFKSYGAFNPLWSSIGSTYKRENLISLTDAGSDITEIAPADDKILPFMFILAVKDRLSNSYTKSNFPELGTDYDYKDRTLKNKTVNTIGSYVCVLNTASTSVTSQQAVIMDNISAFARPLAGGWFTEALAQAFRDENGKNGMDHNINAALYGYFSDNVRAES